MRSRQDVQLFCAIDTPQAIGGKSEESDSPCAMIILLENATACGDNPVVDACGGKFSFV
jgi:hypothetical protein